jgi:hypothetical protein
VRDYSSAMMYGTSIRLVEYAIGLLFGAAVATAGVVAQTAPRHAVAGHFNVLHPHAARLASKTTNNVVTNPGFESGKIDGGWYQCGDVAAYTTMEHPHGGAYDEYSGLQSGSGEPSGNSGVCQEVTIPPNGVLTAWLYQLSNEPDTSFSYQEADMLDEQGNVVVNLYKAVNNKSTWVRGRWNLAAYAGRTYWIYFGVHGDGYPTFATEQFLDDVTLTSSH